MNKTKYSTDHLLHVQESLRKYKYVTSYPSKENLYNPQTVITHQIVAVSKWSIIKMIYHPCQYDHYLTLHTKGESNNLFRNWCFDISAVKQMKLFKEKRTSLWGNSWIWTRKASPSYLWSLTVLNWSKVLAFLSHFKYVYL